VPVVEYAVTVASKSPVRRITAALGALDVADGLISRQSAEQDYRVSVTSDGALDRQATARLRAAERAHQSVGAP